MSKPFLRPVNLQIHLSVEEAALIKQSADGLGLSSAHWARMQLRIALGLCSAAGISSRFDAHAEGTPIDDTRPRPPEQPGDFSVEDIVSDAIGRAFKG